MSHATPYLGWMTLAQMSAHAFRWNLDPGLDYERCQMPLDRCPDAERVRVARWAALHGGPLPTRTNAYRLRADVAQLRLGLSLDSRAA